MDLNRLPDDGASDGGRNGSQGSESDVFCSICLEPANKNVERTVVKLKCNHKFHLGSAFNAKRRMECPNCRKFEKGEWWFESGFVPVADHWNYEDDEDEEMTAGQSYFPEMAVPFPWCPFNDVAPIPVHFNEGNVLAGSYTHASVHHWSGPFVPAEAQVHAPAYAFQGIDAQYHGWEQHDLPLTTITIGDNIIGAEQTPISSPATTHPFSAPQSVSPYYQGVQPGPHAVLTSLQQQYYQQQAYNAPQPNHPAQTLYDPHGPVTGSGFHLSYQNLGTHVTGFPTWTEQFLNQGWEAAQPTDSLGLGNRLNSQIQRPRHTTTRPNHP